MASTAVYRNKVRQSHAKPSVVRRRFDIVLDAESRKLRELESRRGPELSAFERREDATKGPQGALMRP